MLDQSSPWYWMAMAGFGAVYLVASSLLAFQRAEAFGAGQGRGAVLLVAFFVFVIVFLAAFGAFLSSGMRGAGSGTDLANVALFAAFILFGIGSYLIELIGGKRGVRQISLQIRSMPPAERYHMEGHDR